MATLTFDLSTRVMGFLSAIFSLLRPSIVILESAMGQTDGQTTAINT